jgi:hypothetical protein
LLAAKNATKYRPKQRHKSYIKYATAQRPVSVIVTV